MYNKNNIRKTKIKIDYNKIIIIVVTIMTW